RLRQRIIFRLGFIGCRLDVRKLSCEPGSRRACVSGNPSQSRVDVLKNVLLILDRTNLGIDQPKPRVPGAAGLDGSLILRPMLTASTRGDLVIAFAKHRIELAGVDR